MDHGVDELSPDMVFVGGTGRCGTNALKAALATHPDVASLPFEVRFFSDPDGLVDFYNSVRLSWSPYVVDSKLRRLRILLRDLARRGAGAYPTWELERWLPGYKQHAATLIDDLIEFTYEATRPGLSEGENSQLMYRGPGFEDELATILGRFPLACVDALLSHEKKRVFVADETWSVLFADELAAMLPGARFIHMIRDPRDVVVSMMRQRWCPSDLEQAIAYYRGLMDKIVGNRLRAIPERYTLVRLEELASRPRESLCELCEWLGLEYDETLSDQVDPAKVGVGRWEQDLGPEQKKVLVDDLSDLLVALGYEIPGETAARYSLS